MREAIELMRCRCGHYYESFHGHCSKCGRDASEATIVYRGLAGEDEENELDFRPGRASEG